MRASRLLNVLMLLQTRGRMTAGQLAGELDVSVRTIYRDIESLHRAGVALYGEPGPSGGFQLLDGYRTRLTGLSVSEAEALFLTTLPSAAADLGLGDALVAARLKLQAALPEPTRSRTQLVGGRFHLDAQGWYTVPDEVPHLGDLAAAVLDQHRVRVTYRRWREPTDVERVLEPWGVVLKAGNWYVVANPDDGRELRTYKVGAILDLEPLPDRFDRPASFDLAAWWRDHLRDFRARLRSGRAEIRVSALGRRRLRELMGKEIADRFDATASAPDRSGWTRGQIPFESLTQARAELLRLGPEIVVDGPPPLRAAMVAAVRDLAALYSHAESAESTPEAFAGDGS
jgi:predicted DNA-binding transcriptional regulator YafY